uniref:Metalloendopeptidase n=1 Tax=Strigamia maritima TaxID=126957 RepID=T1IJI1_STRMM
MQLKLKLRFGQMALFLLRLTQILICSCFVSMPDPTGLNLLHLQTAANYTGCLQSPVISLENAEMFGEHSSQKFLKMNISEENKRFSKNFILEVFDHFHTVSCVRFVPRKSEKHYVYINRGDNDWTQIGRQLGRQRLTFGHGNLLIGNMIHMFNHVLGFFHEHNRPDRDKYVKVFLENVDPSAYFWFLWQH